MKHQKVRIEMTDLFHGKVFIDDVEVRMVQSVQFTAGKQAPNEVTLMFYPTQVEITAPRSLVTQVEVPPEALDPSAPV
jgi:hypothetical protein